MSDCDNAPDPGCGHRLVYLKKNMEKTLLGSVDVDIQPNGLATITFGHPSHNSLPGRLLKKLSTAITECGTHPEVRLILLKSEGDRTFCAGASFDELAAISDPQAGTEFFMGFANVINACRTCPRLIIGRVQGKTVGGGVGVASAVDYCLATKFAAYRLSELAVGIGPFVVGPAVERKVGLSAMSRLSMTPARWYTASQGLDMGLYAEVLDSVEALDQAVVALTTELLSYSTEAMAALKRVFWAGTEHWDTLLHERAMQSGTLVLTPAARKAITRFQEKNK